MVYAKANQEPWRGEKRQVISTCGRADQLWDNYVELSWRSLLLHPKILKQRPYAKKKQHNVKMSAHSHEQSVPRRSPKQRPYGNKNTSVWINECPTLSLQAILLHCVLQSLLARPQHLFHLRAVLIQLERWYTIYTLRLCQIRILFNINLVSRFKKRKEKAESSIKIGATAI